MKERDYAFGFHDDVKPLFSTGKGLTEEVVREISEIKNEPQWMLDYRLRSLELFHKLPMPDFGPDCLCPTLALICQGFALMMLSTIRS